MHLSEGLAVMADDLGGGDAAGRRRAAQLLALSVALDPVNKRARVLLDQFQTGDHRPNHNPRVAEAKDLMERSKKWLSSSEVGDDGQDLARCLEDLMVADSDAESKSETGKWDGWVPTVSAYEDVKPPAPPVETLPETPEEPEVQGTHGVKLSSASVSVPLWKKVTGDDAPQWRLRLSKLVMSGSSGAGEAENESHMPLVIGNPEVNRKLGADAAILWKLLRSKHDDLPSGVRVRITSPELEMEWPKSRRQAFDAAAAVLASAAFTGVEPAGTIIGQVDASGRYFLPDGYWEQLRSLTPKEAPRVILPADAADDLPSLLAMGAPGFFMDHEVLLAKDFEQLLALSAKKPDDATQRAFSEFQSLRSQAKGVEVGPYVAKPGVRKLFADLAQMAPYHASARMLAVQGAGDRPSYNTRRVLAGELLIALEPTRWLVDHGDKEFSRDDQKKVGETIEVCRTAVEQLRRYAEKSDQPLLDQALAMLASARALDRAMRPRSDDEEWETKRMIFEAHKDFLRQRMEFMSKLSPASKDSNE